MIFETILGMCAFKSILKDMEKCAADLDDIIYELDNISDEMNEEINEKNN